MMLSFQITDKSATPTVQIDCDTAGLETLFRALEDVRRIGHIHLLAPSELSEKTPFGEAAILQVIITTGGD